MISTQGIKVVVLVTLLVTTFIFSMLPLKFMRVALRQMDCARRKRFKCVLSFLSCFAAGVFLGTCLLDLFPEVQEKMILTLDRAGVVSSFPVPEFILSFGFFLILIIEQLVLTFQGDDDAHEKYEPLSASNSPGHSHEHNYHHQHNHSRNLLSSDSESEVAQSTFHPDTNRYSSIGVTNHMAQTQYEPDRFTSETDSDEEDSSKALLTIPEELTRSVSSDDGWEILRPTNEDLKGLEGPYVDPSSHSPIRSFILLVALSLHSIFEGLAIGLQPTSSAVLQIFAPVALHKSILGFSLGLNLVQSKLSVKHIILSNILFCVTSPFGIGIGIVIDFSSDSIVTGLVNGILQGLACGTFIYVVFFEILPHEFMSSSHYPHRLLKTLFLVLGFSAVTVLVLVQPDSAVIKRVCNDDAGH